MTQAGSKRDGLSWLLWGLAGLIAVLFIGRDLTLPEHTAHLDFAVYMTAINEWRAGGSLYSAGVDIGDMVLPFTYPPFAAIVLIPLSFLPLAIAQALWTLIGLSLVALMVRQVIAPLLPTRFDQAWHRDAWLVGSWIVLLFSGPITEALQLGQVSVLIWTLVIVDLTMMPRRFQGILTGIAGGIKLLPMVFVGYFLATRQWRAAVLAISGFAAAAVVGFLVLPQDSVSYWTKELFDSGRVGSLGSQHNKSLLGLLEHWGWSGPNHIVWLVCLVPLVVIGFWRVVRLYRSGQQIGSMLLVGMIAAVAAPISWMHHIPWLPLAAIYLVLVGGRWRWVGAGILIAFSSFSPAAVLQGGLPLWQWILQDTATLVLIAFVVFGLPAQAAADQPLRGTDE